LSPKAPPEPHPETDERARRIGKSSIVEASSTTCPHCRAVLFVRNGRCEECGARVTPPPPVRIVFDQWPLKRLHARDRISDVQFEAGRRYYEHWYFAGLSPIGAIDLNRISRTDELSLGMAASERQAYHRQRYREGEEVLRPEFLPYVNGIVLEEHDPEVIGKRLTGRSAPSQARAVAIELLKIGLTRLAAAYGLDSRSG
jgi:hypothetical protein